MVKPNGIETKILPYKTPDFIFSQEGVPLKSAVTPNVISPTPDQERFFDNKNDLNYQNLQYHLR